MNGQHAWQYFYLNENHQQQNYSYQNFRNNFVPQKPHRQWNRTPFGRYHRYTNREQIFILMSYNILAQSLLEKHSYLYRAHDPQYLDWPHRFECLTKEILALRPAILCLQEVQQSRLDEIADALRSLNYAKPLFKKRTSSDYDDGCAIFYNSQMFELIDHQYVEYFQPDVKTLDRFNVAIIAKFASKWLQTSELVVATTHLLFNPKRDDIRTAQSQVLLAELDRMSVHSKTQAPLPIILTGDFNCSQFSPPYHLLSHGHINSVNLPLKLGITDDCQHINVSLNKERQSTALHNSCKQLEESDCDKSNAGINACNATVEDVQKCGLPYNTGSLRHYLNFTPTLYSQNMASTYQDKWIMVDYVFYTKFNRRTLGPLGKPPTFSSLQLLANLDLPTKQDCYAMGQIPNWIYGSDHYSMVSEFVLMRQ